MRQVSRRFAALVSGVNQWTSDVSYSNDGGQTWLPTSEVAGTVTSDATSQIRWSCDLTLTDVPVGLSGINAYTTQLRITHGIAGSDQVAMGRYKVTRVFRAKETPDQVQVKGSSFECYVIGAQFTATRTFRRGSAMALGAQLIREVLPSAQIAWDASLTDVTIPRITETQDRWSLIDGDRDSNSVARALGCRIYATAEGNWVADPVPSLADDPTWTAAAGDTLVSSAEELSDEGVYNVVIVSGESSGEVPPFRAGTAADLDPTSPTYTQRPVEQGGFGIRVKRYTSALVTSSRQAQWTARAMLAPYLGLRQKVTFTTLHNPAIEPGDVGLVDVPGGKRRVILDSVTYDLSGGPLTAETRTTQTNAAGQIGDLPVDGS